jgi:cell division protein FtsI (penicillin-binding protein 3)
LATNSRDGSGPRRETGARTAAQTRAARTRAGTASRTAAPVRARAAASRSHLRAVPGTAPVRAPRPHTGPRPRLRRVSVPVLPPIRLRLLALLVAMVVAFGAIGIRLFDLQARDTTHLTSLGLGQRVRTIDIPAERGNVFDSTGKILAVSVPQTTITADPRVIKDPAGYIAKLTPILTAGGVTVDQASLLAALSDRKSEFAYVARKVDNATAAKVRKLGLAGVSFVDESKRFYPAGTLAAPVLGFVGTDNNGLGGVEYGYDKTLEGTAGKVQVERDPQGNDIPGGQRQVTAAKRGQDLVLTLDQSLQWNTEQALTQGVASANAKGGTAIIVDVQTGNVLAMATVDGATPDHPAQPATAAESNRPVTDVYEPGSTNKVITMSGAIQEGVVTPTTTFTDIGQSVNIGGTDYEDVDDHPTTMSVTDILAQSSNVGTIRIASMLGKDKFANYLDAFGFGQKTGLGFPGESSGLTLPLADYNDTSMGSIPIGYGVAVTAMQMLDVYSTIANNGVARLPRLVAATIDANGKQHNAPLAASHQVVSAATAKAVTGMLKAVVTEGTGVKAQIPGYPVAGKTGTARKAPYTGEYNASFAGFAPADSPRLSAIVVLDAPTGSIFGADVAAPVFQQIMRFALAYEHVPTAP